MQVTKLPLGAYDFVIHYAEMHDEDTKDFRHSHTCYELFYIRDGELTIKFEGEESIMKSGDIMLIPPQILHYVPNTPSEKKAYFVLCFEFKLVKSRLSRLPSDYNKTLEIDAFLDALPQDRFKLCPAGWDAGVFLDQINSELAEKKLGWMMFTNMLYYGFFLYAIRHIISVKAEHSEADDSLNLAVEATKYIHAHYSEDISLETLAAHLYISTRHANRIFRKMFNTTFGKALRALRLTYAKTLLSTTALPVEEIAERVGLSSSHALRKLFKQSEGITISQYRDMVDD